MGLIEVMVRVLAKDDSFDVGKWCMSRPGVDILGWRKDLFAGCGLFDEEAFEVEEFGSGQFGVQDSKPGFV